MIRRVIAPTRTPGGRSRELAGFRLQRKARLPRTKAFTQATCAASISLTNERELRTTQSAIIDAVCPRGFPMQSDVLAARAFTKDLDLRTTIITNAVRLFRRTTQSDSNDDRMAVSIAKQYTTQEQPPKANGPIAIIFNCVHEWGGATSDEQFGFRCNMIQESIYETLGHFKRLRKPSGDATLDKLKQRERVLTAPRRQTGP